MTPSDPGPLARAHNPLLAPNAKQAPLGRPDAAGKRDSKGEGHRLSSGAASPGRELGESSGRHPSPRPVPAGPRSPTPAGPGPLTCLTAPTVRSRPHSRPPSRRS